MILGYIFWQILRDVRRVNPLLPITPICVNTGKHHQSSNCTQFYLMRILKYWRGRGVHKYLYLDLCLINANNYIFILNTQSIYTGSDYEFWRLGAIFIKAPSVNFVIKFLKKPFFYYYKKRPAHFAIVPLAPSAKPGLHV